MMKKLEPVLQLKKRTTLGTVQALNGSQHDKKAKPECKNQDAFCFPTSPGEKATENTTKDETKKKTKASKKEATRVKKILKVCTASKNKCRLVHVCFISDRLLYQYAYVFVSNHAGWMS